MNNTTFFENQTNKQESMNGFSVVHDSWEQKQSLKHYSIMSWSKFSPVKIVFFSKSSNFAGFAVGVQNCWSGHKGIKEHFVGATSSDRTAVFDAAGARMGWMEL